MSAANSQTEEQTDSTEVAALPSETGGHAAPSPLFILGCVVLPIVWGVIVHQAFRRFRTGRKAQSSDDSSVWPDYQI